MTEEAGAQAAERGREALRRLRGYSVVDIEDGLSDRELGDVEQRFGFRFADDHRAFLAAGLPVNTRPEPPAAGVIRTHARPWPDWRHGDPQELRTSLQWPVRGVLFDVEENEFWYDAWGSRPEDGAAALSVARERLAEVPVMVPVYGHRYLPAGAGTSGHPVLSMYQTDIIYYGLDLPDYIDREFGARADRGPDRRPQATAGFWRDLL